MHIVTPNTPRTRILATLVVLITLGACGPVVDWWNEQPEPAAKAEAKTSASVSDLPPMEDGVYVSQGICFGEGGCPWKNWRANAPVEVRARHDTASAVIATVKPGEWVEALDGQMRLKPRRGVVKVVQDAYTSGADGNSVMIKLAVGDVIYLLEGQGEGDFTIWHRGRFAFWHWPDDAEHEADIEWEGRGDDGSGATTLGWWVRVKLPSGKTGWVLDPSFECMGPLSGDQGCKG